MNPKTSPKGTIFQLASTGNKTYAEFYLPRKRQDGTKYYLTEPDGRVQITKKAARAYALHLLTNFR